MDAGENWGRNIRYAARELHRPGSVEELRRTVSASRGLRALGGRHSFSAIADATGDLVDMTALPRTLEIDEEARTATVSAGSRYGEFAPELDRRGWALTNMGSLPHTTVGGATATGTHGSGDTTGTLSAQVAALELVTPDGELTRIARGEDGFEGAVVALGALGVVVRATLDVVPRFEMRQDEYRGLAWSDVLERLDETMASAYSVNLHTRFVGDVFGSALVKAAGDLPERLLGVRAVGPDPERPYDEASDPGTQKGGVLGSWKDRLPHFKLGFTPSHGDELQSEYFVPRAHGAEALEALHRMGERLEPHLHVSEIRTVAADGLWLSGSGERDVLTIGFTWKHHEPEVLAMLPEVEERLLPLGARPHWGKLFHTRDMEALYPRLDDFRALADRFDPRGKLRNRWIDELVFS